MAKIIVGIHGLSNKPPRQTLRDWWLKAINDGLNKVEHDPIPQGGFELAYWADLLYPNPDRNPQPHTDPDTDRPSDDSKQFLLSLRNAFTDLFGGLVRGIDSVKDQGKIDELKK